ncbi:response regulator [Chitinophagaceae bacterium MMS25-I14]
MNTNSKKILIIDDDPRNIFALAATLRARGYTCITAPGAKEGLQLLHTNDEIGVVLLDMMMPDIDGYEMLGIIRSSSNGIAALPVIALTAQAMKGDREKCLDAGASDYISKPVDVDRLLELLEQYLQTDKRND